MHQLQCNPTSKALRYDKRTGLRICLCVATLHGGWFPAGPAVCISPGVRTGVSPSQVCVFSMHMCSVCRRPCCSQTLQCYSTEPSWSWHGCQKVLAGNWVDLGTEPALRAVSPAEKLFQQNTGFSVGYVTFLLGCAVATCLRGCWLRSLFTHPWSGSRCSLKPGAEKIL